MGRQKLTNEQVIQMVNIIASKYGATVHGVDLDKYWIDADCPESEKVAFAAEAQHFFQSIAK